MVQVERFAVWVASGRSAQFDEFLNLRMVDRQVYRRRAAPQRALADRQGQRIHDADKGDHARGLAVDAHRLAD